MAVGHSPSGIWWGHGWGQATAGCLACCGLCMTLALHATSWEGRRHTLISIQFREGSSIPERCSLSPRFVIAGLYKLHPSSVRNHTWGLQLPQSSSRPCAHHWRSTFLLHPGSPWEFPAACPRSGLKATHFHEELCTIWGAHSRSPALSAAACEAPQSCCVGQELEPGEARRKSVSIRKQWGEAERGSKEHPSSRDAHPALLCSREFHNPFTTLYPESHRGPTSRNCLSANTRNCSENLHRAPWKETSPALELCGITLHLEAHAVPAAPTLTLEDTRGLKSTHGRRSRLPTA